MYFSSRIATVGILAAAFFLVMGGFGSAQLQAQHHMTATVVVVRRLHLAKLHRLCRSAPASA